MGLPSDKRLEWERLLTGHLLQQHLPTELQDLLRKLDQKLAEASSQPSDNPSAQTD